MAVETREGAVAAAAAGEAQREKSADSVRVFAPEMNQTKNAIEYSMDFHPEKATHYNGRVSILPRRPTLPKLAQSQ